MAMELEVDRAGRSELERRRAAVLSGSTPERIERRHAQGRWTARERLEFLLDPGSFVEMDVFARHRVTHFGLGAVDAPGDGVVTGCGRIDGRNVCVAAEDFTVLGGSLGEMHARKIRRVLDLAIETGSPFIQLNDSGGARIQEGVLALNGYSEIFARQAKASGLIPQLSVIMGPAAGGAVYSPALTDFIIMTRSAYMFVTGPDVVRVVTGEEVTFEQLGGADTHGRISGVAHFLAESDQDALLTVRKLLTYLPSNNGEAPPHRPGVAAENEDGGGQGLTDVIPQDPAASYDVKKVLAGILDAGSILEVQADHAGSIVTSLARLGGRVVGVVANQPRVLAGSLDVDSSGKAARFVRFCDAFNIPILTFVDVPGYLPGLSQETRGIIRHGAKLLYAYAEATVPKMTVIMRKAIGGGYIAMASRGLGSDYVLAYPGAEIAVLGPESAISILRRGEDDDARAREAFMHEYRQEIMSPFKAAELGMVDEVILPSETRQRLLAALDALGRKAGERPAKKHGNMPL